MCVHQKGESNTPEVGVIHVFGVGGNKKNSSSSILRKWGWFDTLFTAKDYKVKKLTVMPKCQLSNQRHSKREEAAAIPLVESIPLTALISVLGFTGPTAYFGFLDIGQPKKGETVVVSAAAGAVGSIVCQIAKIKGCRVVGIAGSDEKCNWLKNDLKVDEVINYKKDDILESLKEKCPEGIDIYFENVGGETLDAALTLMNNYGRIPVCGLISMYNDWETPGPKMFRNILMKRLTVKGFLVSDYLDRYAESLESLSEWMAEGKIQYKVDIVEGIENAPSAVNKLFTGENNGKLVIKVSDEP